MAKFLVTKTINQELEIVIEADSAEEAIATAQDMSRDEIVSRWEQADFIKDEEDLRVKPL